jgi:hypothetical protein
MTVTGITLQDYDRGLTSVIVPRAGVAWQGLDVVPAVRAVTDARVGGHGQADSTLYADAAAVTLTLHLQYPVRAMLDELGQFCSPAARPWLVVDDDEWDGPRQIRLRFSTNAKPIALGQGLDRDAQYQWSAPDGLWADLAVTEADIGAQSASTTGLIMTVTTGMKMTAAAPGLDMPPSSTAGDSRVMVGGTASPPWTARLYGPCTGPRLYNDTNGGKGIVFLDALVLGAGQYVELTPGRTANLLSDPAQPQLGLLDFAGTDPDWLVLVPGIVNLLRYSVTAVGAGGAPMAQVFFNPAYIP